MLSSLFYEIYSNQLAYDAPIKRLHCSFGDSVVIIFCDPHGKEKINHLVLLEIGPAHGARDVGVLLNVLARRKDLPQLAQEGPVVAVIQLSELGLDSVGRLLCAVERDAASLH